MSAVLRGFLLELIFDTLTCMKKVFGGFFSPRKEKFLNLWIVKKVFFLINL